MIPLLFGLIFQVYVVLPMTATKETTRVFFLLQDWALGAMYTKIFYTLVLAGPATEFKQTLMNVSINNVVSHMPNSNCFWPRHGMKSGRMEFEG
jgi:hypothetical protein